MTKRIFIYPFLLLLSFVLGCAPIASTELKAGADTSLTFEEVQQNPAIYKGKIVLWGGEILQALPRENGTLIEVLNRPLNWRGKPQKTVEFHGKFLVLISEALDPSVYKRGNRITISGEIQDEISGGKIKGLTDSTYQYTVILSKEMRVWKYRSYSYSYVPDYATTTLDYQPTLR